MHYEIDGVKWRVAEMLGPSFSLYSADEIAELEAALRRRPRGNYSASAPSGRRGRQSSARIRRCPTASTVGGPCASATRRSARSIRGTARFTARAITIGTASAEQVPLRDPSRRLAPGVDVYDQPRGAPHHYLLISPLGRPRLTSCEAPGSSPPKWAVSVRHNSQ